MLASTPIGTLGPRFVIAGTHSGVGKTTVASGLMAAFTRRGVIVASAKIGPDFIDPSYHALATNRASCSLDVYLSGEELIAPLAARANQGADLLIIEGVMGLFDGVSVPGVDGSTAAVSRLLDAPVILVVDASAMSGSVAALVHGFASLDPAVKLAGVILNRVGSAGHETLLREALAPLRVRVLGALRHDDDLVWRDRHLGLVPVAEDPATIRSSLERVRQVIERSIDLEDLLRLARSAPKRTVGEVPGAQFVGDCRVALCAGPAFSFVYPENLALLRQAGAELVFFDPLRETQLPEDCDALYAGGGFPEVFATTLAENRSLSNDVRQRVRDGLVTWAECGGLLWLSDALDDAPMTGVLAGARGRMSDALTIGYRDATLKVDSFLGPAGQQLRGHEFHRSVLEPPGDAMEITSRFGSAHAGYASPNLFASYLHQHLASTPQLAERFVRAAYQRRGARTRPSY